LALAGFAFPGAPPSLDRFGCGGVRNSLSTVFSNFRQSADFCGDFVMKPIAIRQATGRLEAAKIAVDRLRNAATYEEAEAAWTTFLVAANTIYPKLEQGAKQSGKSAPWFGRKKHDRKQDELLNYLHQARNTDEHSIEPVTKHKLGSISVGGGKDVGVRLDGVIGANTNLRVTSIGKKPPTITITPASMKLITVKDARYGDTFDPPTKHLGADLADTSPLAIAELAISYLEGLIAEATELTQ
jgi:hypothetical protein